MSSLTELRTVLSRGSFRRLYGTRLVSQTSDGILQVGLAAYVFFSPQQQPTPGRVAAAFAVLLLPYSLVGPFAGVLLDRWRRRQVLVYANAVRATLVITLAGLVASGEAGPVFFGTALVALSVNRFYLAALSAALPHVVTYRQLIMANSVSTTSGTIVAFAGAGIGYGLRALSGSGTAGTVAILLVAAGVYLGASLAALTMARDLLGPDVPATGGTTLARARDVAHGLASGARHVWQRRPAAAALGAIAGHRFCYGVWVIMTLLLYRNYFHPGAVALGMAGLALVFGASGIGYLAGALVTPAVTRRVRKEVWVTSLLSAAAIVVPALGAPFRQSLLVAAGFGLGVISQAVKICVDTLVQEGVDDSHRGWVFSCYDMLFNVAFVSAAAFAALALPADGASYPVLAVVSAGYLAVGMLYWRYGGTRGGAAGAGGRGRRAPEPEPATRPAATGSA